jgi:hypothetical protein
VLSCAEQKGLVRHSPPLVITSLSSTHIVVYSSLHIHKSLLTTKSALLVQSSVLIQLPGAGSVNVAPGLSISSSSAHTGALQLPLALSL